MNKTFLALCFVIFVFYSCSKGDMPAAPNTITATINGVPMSFNAKTGAVLDSAGGYYSLTVAGFSDTTATASQFSITVDGVNKITPGSYQIYGTSVNQASIVYQVAGGGISYSNGSAGGADLTNVAINSIGTSGVNGSFSGRLVLYTGNSSTTSVVVSGGKFNVGIAP